MDKKLALTLLAMFLLSSCSMLDGLMGEKKSNKIDRSGRISVLKMASDIKADLRLGAKKIALPREKENNSWVKSNGRNLRIPQNIEAPEFFSERRTVKIGKGGRKSRSLGASPVIANGYVYTIDIRGRVTAFDANNIRKKIWVHKIDIPQHKGNFANAGLLYHRGNIYIATGSNKIIAIDADNGSLLWTRKINSMARSAPAAKGRTLFVNTSDNKLYALNTRDGKILWRHSGVAEEISVLGSASPVIFGDMVFAAYSSGELYAIDIKNGEEIWEDNLSSTSSETLFSLADIDASPIVAGDKIYTVSNNGVLTAIDVYSGERVWEREISGNNTPWFAANHLYILNDRNDLLCLRSYDGKIKWIKKLPSYRKEEYKIGAIDYNGPVMAGGKLLVVNSLGRLLSISPQNGDIIHRNKVPKDILLPPVVAYNSVYLLSDNAELVTLRDGKKNKIFRTPQTPTPVIRGHKAKKSMFKRMFGGSN